MMRRADEWTQLMPDEAAYSHVKFQVYHVITPQVRTSQHRTFPREARQATGLSQCTRQNGQISHRR